MKVLSGLLRYRKVCTVFLKSSSLFTKERHLASDATGFLGRLSDAGKYFTLFKNEIQEKPNSKPTKIHVPIIDGYAVVYTDGACENNGQKNAKAGVGVWFDDNHPMNVSKPVIGKATNNMAEIQASTEALKLLKQLGYSKVKIRTDSKFTINCMTKWISTWKRKNWRLAAGGPVKNKEELMALDRICQEFQDVKWVCNKVKLGFTGGMGFFKEYCPGHQGIKGNEQADQLARNGALKYRKNS